MLPTPRSTSLGLARFVAQRAALRSVRPGNTSRLAAFLAAAGPMLANQTERRRATMAVNPIAFSTAMAAIAGPLARGRDAGVLADPWSLAGIKRREISNAAVLAGLWSTSSGGNTASQFLLAFLDRLRSRPGGHRLPELAALKRGYLVRTEHRPVDDAADRIDITIEGHDFLVGIEVKIGAGLQPNQLSRYQTAIGRRAIDRGKHPAVIFLSPYKTSQPEVIQAGWADVAAAARMVASEAAAARSINHHLIERFAAHVARF